MKNIRQYGNLRRNVIFISLLLLVIFPCCNEDVLKEVPLDFLSEENAYSTPAGIEAGISGLHDYVQRPLYRISNSRTLFAMGTDQVYMGDNPGGSWALNDYELSCIPTGDEVLFFWTWSYEEIKRANSLIYYINEIEDTDWKSIAEKNAVLGEVKFFRAFAYRILVYLYGDVPLLVDKISTIKTDFSRTPKAEIYSLIESDLTFAAENLPTRGNEAAPGRITQGAAWHLLSEIYLAQQKWQLAVDATSHVINDYGYALMTERFGTQANVFKNENVFTDLFTRNNQNLDQNTETIWAIQFEPDILDGDNYMGPRGWAPCYWLLGTTPDGYTAFRGELWEGNYTGYSDTLSRPAGWQRPTSYMLYTIWQSDWSNDFRNAEANIKRNFYFDNPASAYDGKKIDWDLYPEESGRPTIADTCYYLYPYWMKTSSPGDVHMLYERSGGGHVKKDIYAMRLAETYLLRAEAFLGLGNKAKAAEDINVVRARSNATPVSPADVDIDYILDERARELYTEEMRRLTLCRLGLLYERVKKYNDNPLIPGLNIRENNNLFPIPQSEIDLNSKNVLEQNPGY